MTCIQRLGALLVLSLLACPAAAQPPANPAADQAAALARLTQAIADQTAKIDALVAELKAQRTGAPTANLEAATQPPAATATAPQPAPAAAPTVIPPPTSAAPLPGDVPLLGGDAAPTLGAPEVIGPFELEKFVAEFHAGNTLRTDQEPDVTAALIAKLFADLAAQARALPAAISVESRQALRDAYAAGVKAILDDPQRGFERRPQWQGFFTQLDAKLAQAKAGVPATFNANSPAHYAVALTELAKGFEELAKALKAGRDLPPSYFQNRGAAMGASSAGAYASGYPAGASHAAVWHARRMNHIMYHYDRRSYKISRLYGR